jgi:hypothetical protein
VNRLPHFVFDSVRNDIEDGQFPIPNGKLFVNWAIRHEVIPEGVRDASGHLFGG